MNRLSHVDMAFGRVPAAMKSDLLPCHTKVRGELVR